MEGQGAAKHARTGLDFLPADVASAIGKTKREAEDIAVVFVCPYPVSARTVTEAGGGDVTLRCSNTRPSAPFLRTGAKQGSIDLGAAQHGRPTRAVQLERAAAQAGTVW